MRTNVIRRSRAFTLVELLVVIGIIALLISILLPSLSKARHAANSVKCAANLHSILLAFQIYGAQNQGYFPGSPLTSGYGNMTAAVSNSYSPYTIQTTDWMTPVMEIQGVKVLYSPSADAGRTNGQARWDRVNTQLNNAGFHCPENDIVSPVYNPGQYFPMATGIPFAAPYVSYCTSWAFMLKPYSADDSAVSLGVPNFSSIIDNQYASPPTGYAPKFSKVGAGNDKICISDGGRYVNFKSTAFDMTFNSAGTQGGAYSDYGPWSSFANGRQRTRSPTFVPAGSGFADDRLLWARHGTNISGASDSAFRFNAGFFDGHVEAMNVAQALDPCYWGPKGSYFASAGSGNSPGGEFSTDVYNKYVLGQGNSGKLPGVQLTYYILPR